MLVCNAIAFHITLYVSHSLRDSLVRGQGLPVLKHSLSLILLCNIFKCDLLIFIFFSNYSKINWRFAIDTTSDCSVLSFASRYSRSFDWSFFYYLSIHGCLCDAPPFRHPIPADFHETRLTNKEFLNTWFVKKYYVQTHNKECYSNSTTAQFLEIIIENTDQIQYWDVAQSRYYDNLDSIQILQS